MKLKKRVCLLILIFNTFLIELVYCQIREYKFLPRNDNFVDTLLYSGLCDMFPLHISTQRNITDSTFIFTRIFCQSDTFHCCNIVFKIDLSGNWYIVESDKEILFFDSREQAIKSVYLEQQCNKDILVRDKITIKNIILHEFGINIRGWISTTSLYWFSEKYGIVAYRGDFCLYVRDDFIEQVLNK